MKKGIILGIVLLGSVTFANAQADKVVDQKPLSIRPGVGVCYYLANDVHYGQRDKTTNGSVVNLQAFLHAKGYLAVEPTGFFGPMTLKAVKQFQKENGIQQTGKAGPLTRGRMKEITCTDEDPTVIVSLKTNKDEYNTGDNIHMTLTLLNNSDQTKSLTFPNSCKVSYTIDGEYNSLAAMMCAMMVQTQTVLPHASVSWDLEHEWGSYELSKGQHTITASVAGYGSASKMIIVK